MPACANCGQENPDVARFCLACGALLAAGPIMRLIGERLEAMITRILGVILAALAAQFVIDGIKQSFPGL